MLACVKSRSSLARAALIIFVAYILSNLTGYAQRAAIVAQFGADAFAIFAVANRVPELLFQVLAGGALASAFIPMFSGYLGTSQTGYAWQLARGAAIYIVLLLGFFALLGALAAPWLLQTLVAPGLDAVSIAQTVPLMRVMLIATVIFGLSGLLMGVLQSNGAFLAPALAPAFYNLGIIFGALALSSWGVLGAAMGVVIGAALHLLVQLPALWGVIKAQTTDPQSSIPNPSLSADLRTLFRLMLPRMAGLGATQVNFLVNTTLASGMGTMAIAALEIGFPTMRIPQAAIAQAIAQALFPTISAQAAKGDKIAFARMLMRAVNIVVALSLPATVGLMALAEPIIRLLYRRGSFDDASASATALALTCFAVGLVGHSVFEVVVRGFYALRDTVRPVIITVVGAAFNIALSLIFTALFLQNGWRAFGGIALANSMATLLEAAALLLWLHLRTGLIRPHVAALWQAFGKASVASALMLAVLFGLARVGLLSNNDSAIAHLIGLVVMISLGGGVYVLAAYLLRSDELLFFVDMLSQRFRRSANTQTKQG